MYMCVCVCVRACVRACVCHEVNLTAWSNSALRTCEVVMINNFMCEVVCVDVSYQIDA